MTGVPFDVKTQLLDFQTGLDPKRFSLEALGALEFQDFSRFGVSSSYTLENCITHLKTMEERQLQQSILSKGDAGSGKNGGSAGGDEALYTSTNKRKNPGIGDKSTKCSWCGSKGHQEMECNKKKNGVPRKKKKLNEGASGLGGSGGASFEKGSATASGSGGGDKEHKDIECWNCKQSHFVQSAPSPSPSQIQPK